MRIRGAVALIVVALLAGALPAGAQQADRPAANLRSKIKAKYLEKRDKFLHRTKELYFAVGCKVLASEAGILPLTSAESYLAFIGDQTIIDTKDESLRQAAVQEGWIVLHGPVNATITGVTQKPQRGCAPRCG